MITRLLLVIGFSIGISAMCSVLEAVLLSISHSHVAVLRRGGDRAGELLAKMREDIEEPISAILTLNTIAHTVGAAVGGAIALQVFGDRWIALFSALLTLAILLFSEILPKTMGARYWKKLATPTAHLLHAMILIMKPILIPLSWFNRLITPKRAAAPAVTRAELEVLAQIGRSEGAIDEDEFQVVKKVINLDQIAVGEVMTPRTAIVAVPVQATVKEARTAMLDHGPLRLPVFDGTIDNVVGILLGRDLWRAERDGVTAIRDVMREPTFVPKTKPVEDLIPEMRTKRIKMAIVLDEFGGTAGLVTLEDLIEEIVGEIHDEHEEEQAPFELLPNGDYMIRSDYPVREVNTGCNLSLSEDIANTVGGYVFGRLGRVAEVGDEVIEEAGVFHVLSVDARRIRWVRYRPAAPASSTT